MSLLLLLFSCKYNLKRQNTMIPVHYVTMSNCHYTWPQPMLKVLR